ncbi:MFS transporter [Ignatzschineria sp. RMDPL8A]|uniref:MFS transporter n=1 Tax=Ignatzschineria sp. RMDPL8A TaxID=2999236 RepID=UPI00244665C4|nr:MFS transporter [Ignatzschineria sp. RMDPL8A]MDG9729773.1 MFS transporter [Ignatzschineria sp. RMDPL8A]
MSIAINADGYPVARRLNRHDYKTLTLSSLGGTLEFYDFVIYALYIETIVKPLFLPSDISPLIADLFAWGGFAAGYIARPIGGVIMAHFGDVLGRKKMFTLSVAMMALPTFIIGLLPTYAQISMFAPILLVIMRMFQGAAIGGEMPGAWVFIAEHTPKNRSGLGIGVLTSGISGGILLGFLVSIMIDLNYSKAEILSYAWRIPFIAGGVFGIIAVYLRRYLSETPIFQEMSETKSLSKEIPVMTVLKRHKIACVIVGLLTWSLSTTIMIGILITPVAILGKMYGMEPLNARIAGSIAALSLSFGCIFWGFMEDQLKTRLNMVLSWGGLALSSLYFYYSLTRGISLEMIYVNYAVMGFFAGAATTPPIIGTRVFPPAVRYSGLSFSYNLAYAIFSAITPMFTLYLLGITPMGAGIYIVGISMLAILVSSYPLSYKGWTAPVESKFTEIA